MSDEYKMLDVENNVKVAVKKLREAYWSNDTERYAQQFVEAEEIIISSICHLGYTVVKEDNEEEKRPHGEWIKHIDDLFPVESTEECSVCHEEQRITGNDDNFCPNCGSDNRPRKQGCCFASEECAKNPCEDCGLREGEAE